MPFGAIFGALFFALFGLWLLFGLVDGPLAPRLFLGLAAFALAFGLLLRRRWARWAGAGFAVAVALLMLRWISLDPGVGPLVFMLGAATTTGLLLLPVTATGRTPERLPAPLVGRVISLLAAVGLCGFVVSLALSGVVSSERSLSGESVFHPEVERPPTRIPWTDFGSGLERAAGQGSPMVVVFGTSWCGYCKKMDRITFKDPQVIRRLSQLVAVRVDAEDTQPRNGYRGIDLASEFQVRGTPSIAVLGPQGAAIAQTSGYLDARSLLDWLDTALPTQRDRSPETISISSP